MTSPRPTGELKPADQWERLGPTVVAKDEKERKAYFQGFEYTEATTGRKRQACGAPRKNCPHCGFRYSAQQRLWLTCPECGLDRRCRHHVSIGKTRCKMHGANQLRGPAHGQYKGGKNSVLWGDKLPDGPRQAFRHALKTMDTRNVFVEMATFQARVEQLSERIAKASDSEAWWVRLGQLEGRARDAANAGDQMDLDAAMNEIMKLARRGAKEADQWKELLSCVKDLANLKQVQGQIERDHKAYLSMSDAMAVITGMAHAMKEAIVLVRDQWRTLDAVLGDDEAMRGLLTLVETDGVEGALVAVRERLPSKSVTGSFNDADRLVQARLTKLIEG